jgi:hypothetical protein
MGGFARDRGQESEFKDKKPHYLILHPAPKTYVIPLYGVFEEIERMLLSQFGIIPNRETRPDALGIEV